MKTNEEIRNTPNLIIRDMNDEGGFGYIQYGKLHGTVVWSNDYGWEHVSINPQCHRTPTWEEMCHIKSMFWNDDETVVQIHPAKSEYVNNLRYCLHLWRPTREPLPLPNPATVGLKDGQTFSEAKKSLLESERNYMEESKNE